MGSSIKDTVDSGSVYIIAEIGQNHQGNLEHAKKLIQKAAEAGVNAVKIQTTMAPIDIRLKNCSSMNFTKKNVPSPAIPSAIDFTVPLI